MTPTRLLVIDDQPSLLHFLRCSMEERWPGCVVDTAESADQARALIGRRRYDAILTDYDLRDGTGLQLAALARKRLPSVPVLLMTASPSPLLEARLGPRHTSVHSLLLKPFDLSRLFEVIESVPEAEDRTADFPRQGNLDTVHG